MKLFKCDEHGFPIKVNFIPLFLILFTMNVTTAILINYVNYLLSH